MATYDIDKITLPSGDVCNLTIPDASATQAGKVSTDTQHFGGQKYFDYGNIVLDSVAHSSAVNYRQISFKDGNIQSGGNTVQNAVIISQTSAVGVTTDNKMGFRLKSPTTDGTAYTSYYDTYGLPVATAGLTANAEYNIITTKNISDIPDASLTVAGKVTTGTQKFGGQKVFDQILSINCSSGTGYPMLYFRDEVHHPVDEVGGYASAGIFNVTSDITKNRLGFALWSPKSDGTGYTTKSESFSFPAVDVERTTNGAYRILTTKGTQTYTASLTTSGWSSNAQTVTVTGMTADAIIMVSAAPASEATYRHSGVYCSAQAANSLTFTCASTPTAAITVNILTIG